MATLTESTQFPSSDAPQSDLEKSPTASSTGSERPSGGEFMNRVVQSAHQTIDRLGARAAPHVDRLEEKLVHADHALHERADQLREVGQGYVRSARDGVREYPLAAVGAALLLGVLIARITR